MTIRNDATRQTIRPADRRTARSVVPRQGQALLDADLDQQARYTLTRIEADTADTLGSPGRFVVPAGSSAFLITPAATPSACGIGTGRGYLGGWLLDNPSTTCTLATQPHPRTDAAVAGPVAMVVKALVRHVDPVEEAAYADPALGDAQAAGRSLVDWQVFPFVPAGAWASPGCATITGQADWQRLVAPSTGTLAVVPDAAPPATDPCSLAPAGGYSRSDNLCYRIEVDGGTARNDFPTADGPRFGLAGVRVKMSRRNASLMVRVKSVSGTDVTVEPPALDPHNWFATGMYAELVTVHDDVDPRAAVAGTRMFQVATASDGVVTLAPAAAATLAALTGTWYLRLWDAFPDGSGTQTVATTAAAPNVSQDIDLGDGVKVRLGAGTGGATTTTFRRGDHWTFAARADGSIDWPAGSPQELPHGPETRYAPLAVLNGAVPFDDCRIPEATLTDRTLLFRGGDGQAVPAPAGGGFATLPAPLRVAVMRGRTPVAGARLRWSTPAAPPASPPSKVDGQPVSTTTTVELPTGSDGTCVVDWSIDSTTSSSAQRVQVVLLDGAGNPEGPALVFNSQFATAANTSYQPGDCKVLSTSTTVQEALDELCANLGEGTAEEPETLGITSIVLLGDQAEETLVEKEFILNGTEVAHDAFLEGIVIGISGNALESTPEPWDPIVEVELDLPYPSTDPDRWYWGRASKDPDTGGGVREFFGYQRMRLAGEVVPKVRARSPRDRVIDRLERGLAWMPSRGARAFLESAPQHLFGFAPAVLDGELKELEWEFGVEPRILCRLRIRSAHVWATGERSDRAWLNAEYLGTSERLTGRELMLDQRDPQRAADLDMFFYLRMPKRG